jgi:hypothetical protein
MKRETPLALCAHLLGQISLLDDIMREEAERQPGAAHGAALLRERESYERGIDNLVAELAGITGLLEDEVAEHAHGHTGTALELWTRLAILAEELP